MSNYIIFDGMKIGKLATGETGWEADVFPVDIDGTPARQFEVYEPIGRIGNIIIDNRRYADVEHSYWVIIQNNADSAYHECAGFLQSRTGYCRLSDSWHTNEFYKAYVSEPIEPIFDKLRETVKFVVTFTRQPQRFLTSGEESVVTTTSQIDTAAFTNPTDYAAFPLIKWTAQQQYLTNSVKLFDICKDNNGSAGQTLYKVGFYSRLGIETYIPNRANVVVDFAAYSAYREAGGVFNYTQRNLNNCFNITKGSSDFPGSSMDFFTLPAHTKLHIVVPAEITTLQFFPGWWRL